MRNIQLSSWSYSCINCILNMTMLRFIVFLVDFHYLLEIGLSVMSLGHLRKLLGN